MGNCANLRFRAFGVAVIHGQYEPQIAFLCGIHVGTRSHDRFFRLVTSVPEGENGPRAAAIHVLDSPS